MEGGTYRWMSPELLDPEEFGLGNGRHTKNSDRYALGMVVYEVLSGRPPFFRHNSHLAVAKVLKGERPERLQGVEGTWFTDDVWSILERCWERSPGDRPRVNDVLQCLEGASTSRSPPRATPDPPKRSSEPDSEEDSIFSFSSHP